jgi:hypothetical protein
MGSEMARKALSQFQVPRVTPLDIQSPSDKLIRRMTLICSRSSGSSANFCMMLIAGNGRYFLMVLVARLEKKKSRIWGRYCEHQEDDNVSSSARKKNIVGFSSLDDPAHSGFEVWELALPDIYWAIRYTRNVTLDDF